jgi:hypothetical protein
MLRSFVRACSGLAAIAAALVTATSASAQIPCCDPWDNGRYDGSGAQTSQVGYDLDWRLFGRVSFDDFWLCEGQVYKVNRLRGMMCTDSLLPKALVVILKDCNGLPDISESGIVAIANSIPIDTTDAPVGSECKVGTVEIAETGGQTDNGFRIIDVTASFSHLWLKGGTYWVAFVGYSGNANPLEQFFWGHAGLGTIKGKPGQFYNSDDQTFSDVSSLCCGCTDFSFCVEADHCKILVDNGGPSLTDYAPSIFHPGSTFREARAADDAVIANCNDRVVCFVEGYLATNCDPPRARLDIWDNACKLPATFAPPATFAHKCIFDTGQTIRIDNTDLTIYKVQFWDLRAGDGSPFTLQQNKNYWFSIYAVGSNSQSQRGYFLGADRCDLKCEGRTSHFNQAAVSGRGVGLTDNRWISVQQYTGRAFDLSLLVALEDIVQDPDVGTGSSPTCAADIDGNGTATVQDLFDFLAAWFAGCP